MVGSVARVPPASYAGRTVGEAMIHRPHLHPADLTVAQARARLADPHVHLLLLVDDGLLVGTLTRDDLQDGTTGTPPGAETPALALARLEGRTVGPGEALDAVLDRLEQADARRVAVVGPDGHLLGLLCRKRSGSGFCTDAGVAARAVAAPRD